MTASDHDEVSFIDTNLSQFKGPQSWTSAGIDDLSHGRNELLLTHIRGVSTSEKKFVFEVGGLILNFPKISPILFLLIVYVSFDGWFE
ncbi:hypothetical protein [Acidicapsa acidisoli]|uniref:hypothetical protein n=1 Tax=Acidicapsa acidisoli TaxID=1615681 RepID=UPI0021E05C31|nr:hypothetical protein [Acidicapsa acidisoli]